MNAIVRPYGDTTGDGMVQVSFTLPVPLDKRAEGAALQLAGKMGLDPAMVVHAKQMGSDFTFFVVYGRANHLVELDKTPPSGPGCVASSSWSVPASGLTRTPSASTRSST